MSLDSIDYSDREKAMTVHSLKSNDARLRWRDILDAARAGNDTVIEHYNRPTAVVIPYEDFVALQEDLEELRLARRAREAYDEWKRAPDTARPYSEIRQELIKEGLLDE